MKNFFNEFKKFCTKGNILELATGVMIGGAFTTIVNSLVNDMLMPVIGLLTGGVNLSGLFIALDGQQYVSIDAAKEARRFGIEADRAADYHCDGRGTALNYEVIGDVVANVRACRPVDRNWKARIDADYQKRGK